MQTQITPKQSKGKPSTENLETLENDCNSVVDENGCNFEKIQNRFRDSVKWSIIHPVHRRF